MNSATKTLIAVVGTTGVGKSQLSIEIAKALNGEIINGDSMQVYSGLDNITNKHPIAERENIPHHLLGHVNWKDEYSVKQFEDEAISIVSDASKEIRSATLLMEDNSNFQVNDIHSRGKLPILVGGTHYYIQSLLFKNSTIASSKDIPQFDLTEDQEQILNSSDSVILEHLKNADPVISQKFHPNDTRRIRRALEVFYTTGRKPSDIYNEQQQQQLDNDKTGNEAIDNFAARLSMRYRSLILWVWCDKNVLDPRLDSRVDQMLKNGLYKEIQDMYQEYKSIEAQNGPGSVDLERGVWQVIGFKQFLPWLKGEVSTPDSGIETMKQATRKYATRQTKWIHKKLLPMCQSQLPSGEKDAALLDATDLNLWKENVFSRGMTICKEFIESEGKRTPPNYSVSLAPRGRESLLEARSSEKAFNADKWKHFTCDICTRLDKENSISIGEEAWKIHISSKRHRLAAKKLEKQDNFRKWRELQQNKAQETFEPDEKRQRQD